MLFLFVLYLYVSIKIFREVNVCYYSHFFRKTKLLAHRDIYLVASPIIIAKKYGFFAMKQQFFGYQISYILFESVAISNKQSINQSAFFQHNCFTSVLI